MWAVKPKFKHFVYAVMQGITNKVYDFGESVEKKKCKNEHSFRLALTYDGASSWKLIAGKIVNRVGDKFWTLTTCSTSFELV